MEPNVFNNINSIEDLPKVKGVDWLYAELKLTKASIIKNVVRDFCILAENDITELRSFYDNPMTENLFKSFRIKVHAMKNSVGMFGALEVSALARTLEYAAADEDYETVNSLIEPFSREWLYMKERLENAFGLKKMASDEDKQKLDESMLLIHLSNLRDSMAVLEVDSADLIMDELGQYRYEAAEKDLLDKLKIAVLNLNSEEALRIIDQWKQIYE